MRRILLSFSLLFVALTLAAQSSLTLADVVGGAYSANGVYGVRPATDGETYTCLEEGNSRIVRRSFKTGEMVATLFDAATARGPVELSAIDGYILSPDEQLILLQTNTVQIYRRSYTAVYYIFDVKSQKFSPLSDGGPQQMPLFSPDGTMVAFAREGNLFLVKLLFGNSESQITKDGAAGSISNGIPDWVYEEEFTTARSFDFSADSRTLAWIRYDESQVPLYSMTMYEGAVPALSNYHDYPGEYTYKYPVAGAVNSTVSVHAFDVRERTMRRMEIPLPEEGYIPRIEFLPQGEDLAIITLNRHQDQMDIYLANPRSTVCKLATREEVKSYVDEQAYTALTFLDDGSFVMMSDRSGFIQLYLYSSTGVLSRQLTSTNNDVIDYYGTDGKGTFYYSAYDDTPLRTAIFSVDTKGKVKKLTDKAGWHTAIFSSTCKYFLHTWSNAETPTVTDLCSSSGKSLVTLVDNNELKQKLEGRLAQKEFFTFTTSESVTLNGYMIKPARFDASKKYPVLMYQYSGPGSQEVTDSWNMGFFGGGIYESYLANQEGFICVCVDGRGTGGRGTKFKKCTYLNLGLYESKDQVEAALYLASLPYVDASRMAIWGWSYGGFNTLMSMSQNNSPFAAGIAVAAPTCWRFYDTVYTERFMRTPAENPTGYAYGPISLASNLKGKLLLVHGLADDNVHFRNAAEYSEALVQAGIQFQEQFYTNRNHNIYGGKTRLHLFTRMVEFLKAM